MYFSKKRSADKIKIISVLLLSLVLSMLITSSADESEMTLEQRQGEAILRMQTGFENFDQSIDLSDLEIKPCELGGLFSDATKNTPYLFYVSSKLSYTYRASGYVVEIRPQYTMSKEEAKAALDFCKERIASICELVSTHDGELERVIATHDLICRSFTYDTTLKSNNLYSFLKNGKGTCQGYTWAYMAILRELGIECRYVASDEIVHIWLAVKINGEWYHSDVTWDDSSSGGYSRAHLLFSDEKADADGYSKRYSSSDAACSDKKYDGEDLAKIMPPCTLMGDTDHNGRVELYDLLLLRLYLGSESAPGKDTCRICADADQDFCLDVEDAEHIRRIILENVN